MSDAWYFQTMGSVTGPLTLSELASLARRGAVTPETLIRDGRSGDWITADQVPELFEWEAPTTYGKPAPLSDDDFLAFLDEPDEPATPEPALAPCLDCEKLVSLSADVCVHCGRPFPHARRKTADELAEERYKAWRAEELEAALTAPIVRRSHYDQIHEGMTYREVVAIIGHQGAENASTEAVGFLGNTVPIKMYSWENPDGSNMNAMFQDGLLSTKAQSGLW